jgi:hypothetical protein
LTFAEENFLLRRLFGLVCLAVLLLPTSVFAQDDVTLSELQVDLWPEFDRPSMLVMYNGTLSPSVSLPATLMFRIPAAAGDLHAVAVRQVDGSLYTADYARSVSGEWSLITFTATTLQFRFEYYDAGLTKDDAKRHVEYQWPGDYAVERLVVRVQQPSGATNMRISPNMGGGQLNDEEGLIYYGTEIGAVSQDDSFTIILDYENESDRLTSGNLQVEPSAPITSDTPGRIDLAKALPWALGALGLLLIAGGGWWYWQSGRQEEKPEKRQRRRATASMSQVAVQGDGVYCHQCGKRAEPGDRFCRACGTKLRIE